MDFLGRLSSSIQNICPGKNKHGEPQPPEICHNIHFRLPICVYIPMAGFKIWLESTVGTDEVQSGIDHLYNKAKYAIKLVQLYGRSTNQKILNNISTVAPLNSGVYGLYTSSENRKVIGPAVANKIKFKFGQDVIQQNSLNKVPNIVIKQHIPDIDEKQIVPSDVIHVNVQRIVRELGDTKEAIVEIASTIVHEATHEIEFQTTGKTSEVGPKAAEKAFHDWVSRNWNMIVLKIPQINL
ncbi:hypothetical protein EBT16_01300 [bacterium]|nr:hypothetical protein [bacterium]